MRNGPIKIVLISAGKYDYGEVELDGALQIVGGNNAGKTTLINTLQLLYIDERSKMAFGSYPIDQSFSYYFPGRFSYVLFECRTARGQAVIGWRGNSKASGAGAERFYYLGPYSREDFFSSSGQALEPHEVSAKLALRGLQFIPKAAQLRELLLVGAGERGEGLGIVSLKDNDKFYQFRETLKNLLSLSVISQVQMRERLLMLAEIPVDQPALERNRILGDDYERLDRMRNELQLFITHKEVIVDLLKQFDECQRIRGELIYRWTFLRQQKEKFETDHTSKIGKLDEDIGAARDGEADATSKLGKQREARDALIRAQTTLNNQLADLTALKQEFAGFAEELEVGALQRLESEVVNKQTLLKQAAQEDLPSVENEIEDNARAIDKTTQSIQHFGQLAVTALREEFTDEELGRLFAILNPDLLQLQLGRKGIGIADREAVLERLREILSRTKASVYQDDAVTIRFQPTSSALSKLENVDKLQTALRRLEDEKKRLADWKSAIERRQEHEKQLAELVSTKDQQSEKVVRFRQLQLALKIEGQWQTELKTANKAIAAADEKIGEFDGDKKAAQKAQIDLQREKDELTRQRGKILERFGECKFPQFDAKAIPQSDIRDDFDSSISQFLDAQRRENEAAQNVNKLMLTVQGCFGDRYDGDTERKTMQRLQEELEAVEEKEAALKLEWNAHIQGLKRRFKQVLDDLDSVSNAATGLTRAFGKVQVSDLKHIKLTIEPHADTVSLIKRIAGLEELQLWSDQAPLEKVLERVREWLDKSPVVRISELFTLVVSVTGPDEKVKHYRDFTQIESDGTTVVIKVLFNLLVLKSQLHKDEVSIPFFLDELERLDPANRRAVIQTAKSLGFIAITAAPSAVGEVDDCYFLEPRPSGRVKLTSDHRLSIRAKKKQNNPRDRNTTTTTAA